MMTGSTELVRFRIPKDMLHSAFDQFGHGIQFADDDGMMIGSVITNPHDVVYWALQYARRVEILEPESTRKAILEAAQGLVETYTD